MDTPAIPDSLELAVLAARIAEEKKGENLRVLQVATQTSIADYFVLACGLSRPQVKAMQEEVRAQLKSRGRHAARIEGADMGWWILMDYGDVVVHLMQPEAREYYDLDGLYTGAEEIDWRAVNLPEGRSA